MAAFEVIALNESTPQLRAPGSSDTYTMPRALAVTGGVSIGSSDAFSISTDVLLRRDAANTLALRNGTAAQAFNVYRTFTDASNYERGTIKWNSNTLEVCSERAGTGAARDMKIYASGLFLYLGRNGDVQWAIDNNSNFSPTTNNLLDVGATTNRIRNLHQGGYLEQVEMAAPAAPAANGVRIYAEDNGSGKTRLMALFATGAAQQIAIEP